MDGGDEMRKLLLDTIPFLKCGICVEVAEISGENFNQVEHNNGKGITTQRY